jgi:16S rRNA (guanine966-N2)-methyltransferase
VTPPRSAAAAQTPSRSRPSTNAAPVGSVRIIGGLWRRTRLPVPDAPGLRPTPDRVRETLFNWLGQDLQGWRVLDAFAGSGALGFEAASRGASQVTLLERDAVLVRGLRACQERLKAAQMRIEQADALRWMGQAAAGSFDLVLLDPPFDADLFVPALQAATRLLARPGFVYLESDRAFAEADAAPLGLQLYRAGQAGKVRFHLLRPAGPPPGA